MRTRTETWTTTREKAQFPLARTCTTKIHDEDYDDFETEDEAGSEEDDDDVVDDMEDDPIKDATQATAEEILAVKKATFASIHDTAETGSVTGMVQAIPHLEISDSLHAHFCGTPITNLICEFAHESFSNSGGLFKLQVGKFVCPSEQITKSKGDVYDVLDLIGSYLPEDETAEVHIHDSLKASEFYTFMALQNTRSIQTFRQAVARCKPVPGARPDTESGAARAAMSSTSLYMRYSSSDSNHMLDHAELAVVDEKVRQKNATSLVIGQKLYKGLVKNLWSGEYTRESEISFSDHVSDLQTTIEFTRIDKKLLYRTELETFVDVPLYSQNACPFHVTGAPHACGLCDLDRQLGVACSKWSPSNPTSVRTTRSEFKALVEPYLAKRDILDEKVAADRQASLDAFHALEEKERIKKQKAKDAIKADKAAAKVAKAEAKAQLEKEKVPLVLQDLLELANASGNSLYCEKHGTCGTKQANRQMQCRRCDEKTVWLCIHPARKGHSCPECSKRHMKMFKLKVAAEEPAAVAEKKKAARDAAKAARDALKASSPASASASLPSAYASASGSGTNAASPSKPVKPKAKVPAKAKPAKVAAKVPAKVPTKVPAKVPVEAVAGRKVGEKGKAASDLSAPAAKKLKFEDLRREVAGLKDLAHRLLKDAERVEQLLGAADADSDA